MEEFDSPRIFRSVIPSPLRPSPSPSKEVLQSLYSSHVPLFLLEAIDNASMKSLEVELPRHYLPSFNFRMVNGLPHPTTEQFIEVASYFLGCASVAYTPPFLVVLWPNLPRKPWPLTFGGIPLFYGTLEDRRPPTCGRAGSSQPILTSASDLLEPGVHPQGKIKEVLELLVAKGIEFRYFGWSGVRWYAEVLSASDGAKLPSQICGLLVLWKIWENEESESARRGIVPDGGIVIDTTSYAPTLRPGALVESAGGRGSTCGIPLLAPSGERYITVAKHGFLEGDLSVYHPIYGEDKLIARIESSFPNSDIALAKLVGGITYCATSFDGDELNGTTLDGLVHSHDVAWLTTLFLDSPFNGKCEGVVTSIGFYVLPIGSTNGGLRYVECNMTYFGNGANDIFLGSCGSPMWTAENKVAAFFRWYFTRDAIAFAPTVDILINSGFDIDPIV